MHNNNVKRKQYEPKLLKEFNGLLITSWRSERLEVLLMGIKAFHL